jgi:hypothetical protein
MSKMCHILQTITDFLEAPYDSVENPLSLIFGLGAVEGQNVPDFSLRTKIGMSKGLCIKAILLGAVNCDLTDDELKEMLPRFQSYYSVRCIFKPEGNEKDEKFSALQSKMLEGSRPRPDCFQGYATFSSQASSDGLEIDVALDQYFLEFEGGSDNSNKHWSDLEKHIIRALHTMTEAGRKAVSYHWDNFPAKQSGS